MMVKKFIVDTQVKPLNNNSAFNVSNQENREFFMEYIKNNYRLRMYFCNLRII